MRVIITFLLLVVSALCQTSIPIPYIATTGNVSLSGTTTAATLQQPISNSLPVIFPANGSTGASVYCSVACVASIIINTGKTGAATATIGTVNLITPPGPVALVNFYTASNFSGGTTLASYNIQAGQTFNLDMSSMKLGGPLSNITISIASITGTANITFYPLELH